MIKQEHIAPLVFLAVVLIIALVPHQHAPTTCVAEESTLNHVVSVREFNPTRDINPTSLVILSTNDSNKSLNKG